MLTNGHLGFIGALLGLLSLAFLGPAAETVLPEGDAPAALVSQHFPDRVHEFVWRNWSAVEPGKLAKVLGTSETNVKTMAVSMGLPADPKAPRDAGAQLRHADALAKSAGALPPGEPKRLRAEARQCLESEISLAKGLFTLTRQDSRIGFEPTCQYFYLPLDLVEKVVNCRWLLEHAVQ